MVSRKLAIHLFLTILVLVVAAACSRGGEIVRPTSTPTLAATATPGGAPDGSKLPTPSVTMVAIPTPSLVTAPSPAPVATPSTTRVAVPSPTPADVTRPTPVAVPTPTLVAVPSPTLVVFPTPTPLGVSTPTRVAVSRPTPVSGPVDGYLAVAPSVLRSNATESISVSLFSRGRPASGEVVLTLLSKGVPVSSATGFIRGQGNVDVHVPSVADGVYELAVEGPGFSTSQELQVESRTVLFLETDKPVYKPGQTVNIRVLTLDPELKPVVGHVVVEAQDAKGIKIFRKTTTSDEYGMTTLELPLSTEPNLGVWKLKAFSGKREAQLDIRVEEYVLPKYDVDVDLPRSWILTNEPITGAVSSEYSFGRPVKGEATIVATRYVGTWEQYASVVEQLDGTTTFELPAPGYVAGVPGARGMGNVQLQVSVRERSTGYVESTTQLITVAASPLSLQVIPESNVFKPGLPFSFLVVTETPDNQPLSEDVSVRIQYTDQDLHRMTEMTEEVTTQDGKALLTVTPPSDAVAFTLEALAGGGHASLTVNAGYSPSGSFIHLEQVSDGPLPVGDVAEFHVAATREAGNFYFEVLSRGMVVFSDYSPEPTIRFTVTPLMAPGARLLVYQILPTSEVAADYLPFSVEAAYPHEVTVGFGENEVRPGDEVDINVQTQGAARVGLVAVDRSVYILAENRLNLQQVFSELERLYQQPQVELHEARPIYNVYARGASETFEDAGVIVMTNQNVPDGKEFRQPRITATPAAMSAQAGVVEKVVETVVVERPVTRTEKVTEDSYEQSANDLAEVQRVRQFFPETWLWTDLITDQSGHGTVDVIAPDTITTWKLRAVGMSREHGLGISEAELTVFQEFFLQVDLPFSAVRGEELPVRVALYNYLDSPQEIFVDLEATDDFDLLDEAQKVVTVQGNEIGGATFTIRPITPGMAPLKVTARSAAAADAVIKELLIKPEGAARETVDNLVLSAGNTQTVDATIPSSAIADSGRVHVAVTGSYLTQSIEGLEQLLKMPFGCGEQNMILFAPNVFVARYLKETGQIKPEVMARAENLMITGYQRELTYRRSDGSFSAFGDNDAQGSLWLTAFVLKTFAQADGLIYIDPGVLEGASDWIVRHQKGDGSFEPVGFLHHQELLGGLHGKNALTAFVTVALLEAGQHSAAAKAVRYLEGQVDSIEDAYGMAITTYALELSDSPSAGVAYDRLMGMAQIDDDGLHWGDSPAPMPLPITPKDGPRRPIRPQPHQQSAAIETTAYATLALLEHGDRTNASSSTRWLVTRRNSSGGFGSTQDTVVGLQSLTEFSVASVADVDMTITLSAGSWQREVRITGENADVLQMIEVPEHGALEIAAHGKGEAVVQVVRRFNLPEIEQATRQVFDITVDYGTDHVKVDDLITVSVNVRFTPFEQIEAGMVVLDIAVPTGFAPVADSIEALVDGTPRLKRFDVAGRKVILYLEDLLPNESITLEFAARAMHPVRAKAITSEVYSYYNPDMRGESLGGAITVVEGG